MLTMYADYGINLVVDVAAIFLLAYVLYFRRHRRADLLLAYVSLNVGIFVAMSLLSKVRVDSRWASGCSRSCRSSGCGPRR